MQDNSTETRGGSSLQPDCCALAELPRKRRNIGRWRENRLRRLEFEARMNRATPRQLARIAQLEAHNDPSSAAGWGEERQR